MTHTPEVHKAPFAVEWREGFCIGIDHLDREHRHLFSLVLMLNPDTVACTVEKLREYVRIHFSHEQAVMEKCSYPSFEEHLKQHEAFATKVAEFMMGGNDWTEDRVQELRRYLNKWLITHIMTHDMRFGKWFAAHRKPVPKPEVGSSRLVNRLLGRHAHA